MSEAALLRILADKIDGLDAVTAYPSTIADPGVVSVSWTAEDDHPGYEALSEAIATLVGQHWNALRSQVIKQRETEVQAARAALADGGTAEKSSAISAGVEAALRKVAG